MRRRAGRRAGMAEIPKRHLHMKASVPKRPCKHTKTRIQTPLRLKCAGRLVAIVGMISLCCADTEGSDKTIMQENETNT